jgi:hypothetical protein
VSALTSVDADPAGKKLPSLPERVSGGFTVKGVGFSARLRLPISKRTVEVGQYRIGDAAHWQKLVDNMAAIVAELDRTFVPAIEAAAGAAPEWFTPEG